MNNGKYDQSIQSFTTRLNLEQKPRKVQKSETDADPPQGRWGVGSKEPTQSDYFLLEVKISEN